MGIIDGGKQGVEDQKTPPLRPEDRETKRAAKRKPLTVRLLVTGAGTATTELLGLRATVVGDEEGTVVLGEGLLDLVLGVLIDELLVVGDDGLGDGLTDGVDLRGLTTARDADADVDAGELVGTDDEEGLVDL